MTALVVAASIGSEFDRLIVDPGKLPAFLFLCAFLGSFGFIRTSTHMIKAQVSWWPGNVSVGGTHIHHMFWGILMLMIAGWFAVAIDPGPPGREIAAIFFGIGTGLTLDEFALWLELKDVYWSQDGRKSIDAVIVAGILAGFGLLGLSVWIDAARDIDIAVHAVVGFFGLTTLAFVAINFAKEKFGMGVAGLFVPPLALIGGLRLGRPGSPWARLFYRSAKKKHRAATRFAGKRSPHLPEEMHRHHNAGSGGEDATEVPAAGGAETAEAQPPGAAG